MAGRSWQATLATAAQALAAAPAGRVAAVAITNQRSLCWRGKRATGRPLGPCVTWQCKRRAFLR
ncbi:MAG: hypothetical protein R2844_05160 [Caldilineales bacterium]